ncbi:hypothetical protein FA13DRAFT_1734354 [Coprinellus micaceus]|uniref:Uncharacterized protein n=1 Tax=Coprinellus micaceus TaxID=71717 RepID=A0A4Y7T8R9_COPMI|nr:hypothetical protein FA13DRAFT_1734354 [Coprinellus micaceus]
MSSAEGYSVMRSVLGYRREGAQDNRIYSRMYSQDGVYSFEECVCCEEVNRDHRGMVVDPPTIISNST